MLRFLQDWHFWVYAFVGGPLVWGLLLFIIYLIKHNYRAVQQWYWGLPLIQYPAMLLIILGAKRIRKPYGQWKIFEDRWWFTVNTPGFNVEDKQ